jgi:hypothetical protein
VRRILIVALAVGAGAAGWQVDARAAETEWARPVVLAARGASGFAAEIDGDGDAVAVWAEGRGDAWRIRQTERPLGGEWTQPGDLVPPVPWRGIAPCIAVNARGDVIAAWMLWYRQKSVVQGAYRRKGQAWSPVQTLSRVANGVFAPAAGIDQRGGAVVVWDVHPRAQQTAILTPAGRWGGPTTILRRPVFSSPILAVAPDGRALATWVAPQGRGQSRVPIVTIEKPPGRTWGTPRVIARVRGSIGNLGLSLGNAGRAAVVWVRRSPGTPIEAVRRTTSGRWTSPVTLSRPGGSQVQPAIAMGRDGQVIVAWARWRGAVSGTLQVTRFARGRWTSPRTIARRGVPTTKAGVRRAPAPNWLPSVAIGPNGRAAVIFVREIGRDRVPERILVQVSREGDGGTWSAPQTIGETTGGFVGHPRIAFRRDGRLTAWWSAPTALGRPGTALVVVEER